ncbi:MAG: YeaH/YhbH family protein [Gammaproteobacteria bacterium]
MTQFIDRRSTRHKSTVNRRRFMLRYQDHLKKAVFDAVGKRNITDIDQGEQVVIPAKDIAEPNFQHAAGGIRNIVLPGNDQYITGDKIQRPEQKGGQGSGSGEASNEGEGADDFIFELTREEFLEYYFEDLELPDLVKKDLCQINTFKTIRAGFSTTGIPTNINVIRSMRQALGRKMSVNAIFSRRLEEAEQNYLYLKAIDSDRLSLEEALNEIELIKKKIKAIPFIDTIDLRYNNRIKIPAPATNAVMFCIMDVSGSMDEIKKDIAKRFFILLYLFLKRAYSKIELVFIRHHTSAKEVTEQDFFYSRETGGTVVSSALELLLQTIQTRFNPSAWNVYVAQASDGDNWNADSPHCMELLHDKIMPLVQYFSYIEIMPRHHQSLWEGYTQLTNKHPNFAMQNIDRVADIYPVFRELFKRKRG